MNFISVVPRNLPLRKQIQLEDEAEQQHNQLAVQSEREQAFAQIGNHAIVMQARIAEVAAAVRAGCLQFATIESQLIELNNLEREARSLGNRAIAVSVQYRGELSVEDARRAADLKRLLEFINSHVGVVGSVYTTVSGMPGQVLGMAKRFIALMRNARFRDSRLITTAETKADDAPLSA